MRSRSFPWFQAPPRRANRVAGVCVVAAFTLLTIAHADAQQRLVSQKNAKRLMLTRAWYSVATVDPNRGRLTNVLLEGNTLIAITDRGAVQAIDAASGATLWTSHIGNPDYPCLGPAANADYVAVVNGSTLYLLGRKQGNLVHEWRLSGGVGGGPCFLGDFVYTALFNGTLESYKLSDRSAPPWRYQANGRSLVPPIATDTHVLWPTDRGHLYAGRADPPGVNFRLEANDQIVAAPAYLAPLIFAASVDGYVYALDATNGDQRWRYSVGQPVRTAPAAVLEQVFICTSLPEMICLDATMESQLDTEKSLLQWRASGITRFVARSLTRVYALDAWNRLHVLDANSGDKIGSLPTQGMSVPIMNQLTDRLYLASPGGLIQCLHEADSPEPVDFAAELERRAQEAAADGTDGGDPGAGGEETPAPNDDAAGAENDDNPFE